MSFWDELENGEWEDEDYFSEEEEDIDFLFEDEDTEEEIGFQQYNTPRYQDGDFTRDIVQKESGGNYKATNPNSSASGKYQFLWNTWGDKIREVTGVSSKQEFLNSPEAQDYFYNSYYVPNEMNPAVNRIKQRTGTDLDENQLRKLYHFRGEKGATDYLQGRLSDKPESYNSSISSYIRQFGGEGNILSGASLLGENLQFQNYPDYENPTPIDEELYDFGFVEDMYDIYGGISGWLKSKGKDLATNISTGIDFANDYLSDLETQKNFRKRNRMREERYSPVQNTINNIPILS